MIEPSIRIDYRSVQAELGKLPTGFRETIRAGARAAGLLIERDVKAKRFVPRARAQASAGGLRVPSATLGSDAHSLGVITGTARRSVVSDVEEFEGGIRAIVGSNLVYFRAHELGFDGAVQVRAHVRRLREQVRSKAGASRVKRSIRAGRAGYAFVRPYTMQMSIRARRMIGYTVEQDAPRVADVLRRAVRLLVDRREAPRAGELL